MSHSNQTIEAEGFVLKDAQGNIRAELSLRQGRPGLFFYDENKKTRAALVVDADAMGFEFFDEAGLCRVCISLDKDRPGIGTPSISLAGPRGEGAILLGIGPDGFTTITFLGKDHKPILQLPSEIPVDPAGK